MQVEVNTGKQEAKFRNGKYEYTFTPNNKTDKVKLYHMGCNGTTQLSRIQLERGEDVTTFERPFEKANSLSGIFKQLRDLDIEMRDETSEFWGRLKLNNKGLLTEFQNNELKTLLASTAEGVSTQVKKELKDSVTEQINSTTANLDVKFNQINSSIQTIESGVLKKSEITINENGISLGSGKEINGKVVSSLLTASPDGIKAITDRLVLSPNYDNLVIYDYRKRVEVTTISKVITPKIVDDNLKKGDCFRVSGTLTQEIISNLPILVHLVVEYEDGTITDGAGGCDISGYNTKINDFNEVIEVYIRPENQGKKIKEYHLQIYQRESVARKLVITNFKIYKQRDAELIVDGTIKSRHIGAEEIKAGNIKAGAIESQHIDALAIEGKHLRVDNAMINKLTAEDAFIDKLFARNAFIKNLKAVKISSTQLETDFLRAYKGYIGGFQIGKHDKDGQTAWWLTGQNQFYVGMSNGSGTWGQTALWVNWGTRWDEVGPRAWYVKESGEMYCKNTAYFWNTPTVIGNLKVTGNIIFNDEKGNSGKWLYSHMYERIENKGSYVYFYYPWGSYDWVAANKDVSDRRYKRNIKESEVNALEVLNKLNTYSYTKEYDGEIKDVSCGIMAQEVEEHLPDAFKQLPDDIKSYGAFELVPYLIKGIQELSKKNDKLEKEMEILKHGK